jgi:hypothetical protein
LGIHARRRTLLLSVMLGMRESHEDWLGWGAI